MVLFFSKFSFLFHLKNHPSKDVNFKFQLKQSRGLDVGSDFVYYSCLYLIVFINFFQMEHFSAVKFAMVMRKIMSFLVIAKSPNV